ncbi:MAG: hypothetical protein B6D41_08120 [Chloroflexi bacterium UTCFX4]|jgi:8-oxo-dGTP pyrophosphatase MutT (NUDIX family)|nr:MAG: hypothetical protein B6D41_08120 [Chloroflexi bacterium UTCFX4]
MTEQIFSAETYYGKTKPVTLNTRLQRVGVYAIIIEDACVLMLKMSNGRYYFPGGGIEATESLEEALKREVREELGVEVEIGTLLYADNLIYYHDPFDYAAHCVRLFYACYPLTRNFNYENAEEANDFQAIEWVDLQDMNPSKFLPSVYHALNAIKKRIKER